MRRTTRTTRVGAAMTAALALVLALAGCSPSEEVAIELPAQVESSLDATITQQLQDAVSRAMVSTGSTGAIVGVWVPWSGTWVSGLGTTSPGGAAVTADMQFKATDVTRAMTCDVLYGVVAEGKAALDDPVTKYLVSLPGYDDITLQSLCDSTSGLPSYQGHLTQRFIDAPQRVWDPREIIAYGLGENRTANQTFSSSDTGYVLLGLALQRATNTPIAELLDQHVFDPLGISETTSLPAATANLADQNSLHGFVSLVNPETGALDCVAPREMTNLSSSAGSSADGVVTDIAGLGRYVQSLAAGALPSAPEGRFDDLSAADPAGPSWITAGAGVFGVGPLVGQYGSTPGYMTAAFADPETGLAVAVVLNNSANGAAQVLRLAWELSAIAATAPGASGQTAPEIGLPFTAQQFSDEIAANAICAAPAPEPAAEEESTEE